MISQPLTPQEEAFPARRSAGEGHLQAARTSCQILTLIGGAIIAVGLSLHVAGFAPIIDEVTQNVSAALGTTRTALHQTKAALVQSADAVRQIRITYHQFSSEVVPAATASLESSPKTFAALGASLIAVGATLDVALPVGMRWKSWIEVPELTYAHPLQAASQEIQAQGATIQKLGTAVAATRATLSTLGPGNDQVTPALAQAEDLLRSLASEHLPRIEGDLTGIQVTTTRLTTACHFLAMSVWLIGLGFVGVAHLGRQCIALMSSSIGNQIRHDAVAA